MRVRTLALAVSFSALGCFPFDGGEHRLDDEYFLRATDIREQMALYRHVSDGNGIQRVGATVFAAGADAKHVIVQRHPTGEPRRTEFFILERAKDTPHADPDASVTGPLTRSEFERARQRLGVAPTLGFSVVIDELR